MQPQSGAQGSTDYYVDKICHIICHINMIRLYMYIYISAIVQLAPIGTITIFVCSTPTTI